MIGRLVKSSNMGSSYTKRCNAMQREEMHMSKSDDKSRQMSEYDRKIKDLLAKGAQSELDAYYEAMQLKRHPSYWKTTKTPKFSDVVAACRWWPQAQWRDFETTAAFFAKNEVYTLGLKTSKLIAKQPPEIRKTLKTEAFANVSEFGASSAYRYVTRRLRELAKPKTSKLQVPETIDDMTKSQLRQYLVFIIEDAKVRGITLPTPKEVFGK